MTKRANHLLRVSAAAVAAALAIPAATACSSESMDGAELGVRNKTQAVGAVGRTKADVLSFLADLPNQTSHVLTGQYGGYSDMDWVNPQGYQSGWDATKFTEIQTHTGLHPAYMACDYNSYDKAAPTEDSIKYACNTDLKAHWDAGGLVGVGLHMPNPFYECGYSGQTLPCTYESNDDNATYKLKISDAQIDVLLNGYDENASSHSFGSGADAQRFKRMLDTIADGLKDLKDHGTIVIWRPYHEANGWWFTFSCAEDNQGGSVWDNVCNPGRAQRLQDLWKQMYDYFTSTPTHSNVDDPANWGRGLDNLIWAYSPDANRDNHMAMYPGDAYVDFVSMDNYLENPSVHASGTVSPVQKYADLTATGKPFGFLEVGKWYQWKDAPCDDSSNPCLGLNNDWNVWLNAIKTDFPLTTIISPWDGQWGWVQTPGSTTDNAKTFFEDPIALSRGQFTVPDGGGGGTGGSSGTGGSTSSGGTSSGGTSSGGTSSGGTGSGGSCSGGDVVVEAESGTLLGNAQVQSTISGSNGGYVGGMVNAPDGFEVDVNVASTGSYTLRVRYNHDQSTKEDTLYINGTSMNNQVFPASGATSWATVDLGPFTFDASITNKVKFVANWGYTQYDTITVVGAGSSCGTGGGTGSGGSTGGCTTDAECDNGLYCDGVETCNAGTCQSGTAVDCNDGISCTVDSCNESTDSCNNATDDSLCDNGLFCDGAETCSATLGCQSGTTVDCNDGISCTNDSCNESTDSCDNATDDSLCDNGLFCDGAETCSATLGCQDQADPCSGSQTCNESTDVCEGGSSSTCTVANSTEMPAKDTQGTAATDACLKLTDATIPTWWNNSSLQLVPINGTWPLGFSWENCAGVGGSGTFTANWSPVTLSNFSKTCPLIVTMEGAAGGTFDYKWQ